MALTSVEGSLAPADRAAPLLTRLAERYQARHGVAVFDVAARAGPGQTLIVEGTVLLDRQRVAVLGALEAAGLGPVDDRIQVLARREGAAWMRPRRPLVAVLSAPDGERATDLAEGDLPMRCLARSGPWCVVDLADETVGWVRAGDIEAVDPGDAPASVSDWRADYRGAFRPPDPAAWERAARAWLGVPYRWGGTTRQGVDCSGLVQRLVRQVAGLGLPKHSTDQMRRGRRIAPSALAPGDLVYLTRRGTGVGHVALVVGSEPVSVVHAGLAGGVAIEALDDLVDRYVLRGAARLGPPPTS